MVNFLGESRKVRQTFSEKSGTFTNIEKRIQFIRPGMTSKDEVSEDWYTLIQIAKAMGSSKFEYKSSEEIFSDISNEVSMYSDISYDLLDKEGIVWTPNSWSELFSDKKSENPTNNQDILLKFDPINFTDDNDNKSNTYTQKGVLEITNIQILV